MAEAALNLLLHRFDYLIIYDLLYLNDGADKLGLRDFGYKNKTGFH